MDINLDMDVVRRCTLRWPIAGDLDLVATEKNPTLRCIMVARILEQVQDDPELGRDATIAIESLRAEAKRRHSGERVMVPSLTTPVRQEFRVKERNHA